MPRILETTASLQCLGLAPGTARKHTGSILLKMPRRDLSPFLSRGGKGSSLHSAVALTSVSAASLQCLGGSPEKAGRKHPNLVALERPVSFPFLFPQGQGKQ